MHKFVVVFVLDCQNVDQIKNISVTASATIDEHEKGICQKMQKTSGRKI